MSNKSKSSSDNNDFMSTFIEAGGTLIMVLLKTLFDGMFFLFNRYVLKIAGEEKDFKINKEILKRKKTCNGEDDLGYSLNRNKIIKTSDLVKKRHTAIVGASGYGKTVLLDVLMYDDMKKGKPVVFIDPKGDKATLLKFINLCRIAKREFNVFSVGYFDHGKCALNTVADGNVTNIVDRIHSSFKWSEPHYEYKCYEALRDAVKKIKRENRDLSLKEIHQTLLDISTPEAFKKGGHDRNQIQGIITRIGNIIDSEFGPMLDSKDALSFSKIREEKKCVYIGLPVLGYAEVAKALGKIFLGDLAYSISDQFAQLTSYELNNLNPMGVYIDELSAVITDNYIEVLNKCRGAGVELNYAFQSPSDIEKVNPQLITQMLESTDNWFIFKQRMESGAGLFAEAIGTKTTKKLTSRVEDGREQDMGSQREVEELIVHHNIIKNLQIGQSILLRQAPTKVDLLQIKFIDPRVVDFNVEFLENEGAIDKLPALTHTTNSIKPTPQLWESR